METEIKGKVVVVTGGAQGIGLAISEAFIQHDAKAIAILDLDYETGNETRKYLTSKYGANKAVFYQCDVTKNFNEVFDKIVKDLNAMDVLVNCAGVYEERSLRKTFAINTIALMDCALKFWEHARKDKGGKGGTVINMASVYGFVIDPFCPFYKASKHAVMGFTTTMGHAYNFKHTGVRVVAICPGLTKTRMLNDVKENEMFQFRTKDLNMYLDQQPPQEAAHVAKAVIDVFIAGYTGSAWEVTGGQKPREVIFPKEFHIYNV